MGVEPTRLFPVTYFGNLMLAFMHVESCRYHFSYDQDVKVRYHRLQGGKAIVLSLMTIQSLNPVWRRDEHVE